MLLTCCSLQHACNIWPYVKWELPISLPNVHIKNCCVVFFACVISWTHNQTPCKKRNKCSLSSKVARRNPGRESLQGQIVTANAFPCGGWKLWWCFDVSQQILWLITVQITSRLLRCFFSCNWCFEVAHESSSVLSCVHMCVKEG